jgi:hypothetical protein
MKLGEVGRDARGFELIEFRDKYDTPCSLQMSSLAEYEQPGISAVWFGPDYADPKVMASKAARLGVETTETTGWVPYPVPREVLLTTRAHLDRAQVKALIDHLQAWLETGSFDVGKKIAQG